MWTRAGGLKVDDGLCQRFSHEHEWAAALGYTDGRRMQGRKGPGVNLPLEDKLRSGDENRHEDREGESSRWMLTERE